MSNEDVDYKDAESVLQHLKQIMNIPDSTHQELTELVRAQHDSIPRVKPLVRDAYPVPSTPSSSVYRSTLPSGVTPQLFRAPLVISTPEYTAVDSREEGNLTTEIRHSTPPASTRRRPSTVAATPLTRIAVSFVSPPAPAYPVHPNGIRKSYQIMSPWTDLTRPNPPQTPLPSDIESAVSSATGSPKRIRRTLSISAGSITVPPISFQLRHESLNLSRSALDSSGDESSEERQSSLGSPASGAPGEETVDPFAGGPSTTDLLAASIGSPSRSLGDRGSSPDSHRMAALPRTSRALALLSSPSPRSSLSPPMTTNQESSREDTKPSDLSSESPTTPRLDKTMTGPDPFGQTPPSLVRTLYRDQSRSPSPQKKDTSPAENDLMNSDILSRPIPTQPSSPTQLTKPRTGAASMNGEEIVPHKAHGKATSVTGQKDSRSPAGQETAPSSVVDDKAQSPADQKPYSSSDRFTTRPDVKGTPAAHFKRGEREDKDERRSTKSEDEKMATPIRKKRKSEEHLEMEAESTARATSVVADAPATVTPSSKNYLGVSNKVPKRPTKKLISQKISTKARAAPKTQSRHQALPDHDHPLSATSLTAPAPSPEPVLRRSSRISKRKLEAESEPVDKDLAPRLKKARRTAKKSK